MQVFIYCSEKTWFFSHQAEVELTLEKVAHGTDTRALVVALYLLPKTRWVGGTAYCRHWLAPKDFVGKRGKWRITGEFGTPRNLPPKFKLIRMLLRPESSYPVVERDLYNWKFIYSNLFDQMAMLFAHELHHYRRYHLGLHAGQGEKSANKWALKHVQELGFNVVGVQLPAPPRRRKKLLLPNPIELVNPLAYKSFWSAPASTFIKLFGPTQKLASKKLLKEQQGHFEKLRSLLPGTELHIIYDPSKKYLDQKAKLVRIMRRNSVRIVVQTTDGKKWRWPMAWLKPVDHC